MAPIQRADRANPRHAARLHAARTTGKSSCQKKGWEAADRNECNLPLENERALTFHHVPLNADYHADYFYYWRDYGYST